METEKVSFRVGKEQVAMWREEARRRGFRLGMWVILACEREMARGLRYVERRTEEAAKAVRVGKEAKATWPSGWPKDVRCPDCGRLHPDDPAKGHGWVAAKLDLIPQMLQEMGCQP